jgi:hypothetical protein
MITDWITVVRALEASRPEISEKRAREIGAELG